MYPIAIHAKQPAALVLAIGRQCDVGGDTRAVLMEGVPRAPVCTVDPHRGLLEPREARRQRLVHALAARRRRAAAAILLAAEMRVLFCVRAQPFSKASPIRRSRVVQCH